MEWLAEPQSSKYHVVGEANLEILAAFADGNEPYSKMHIIAAARRITSCIDRAWQVASAAGSRSGAWAASR